MRALTSLTSIATALALSAGVAAAQTATPISDQIAAEGLLKTVMTLDAIAEPTDDERFALGGAKFLWAIERSLQARYRADIGTNSAVPLLRLPIPRNPTPIAFEPWMVSAVFSDAVEKLTEADEALAGIDGDVSMTIDLTDLWFDINENGTQDDGEALYTVTEATLGARPEGSTEPLIVRFDTADVAWLRAYANLLAGISEVVLAYDPTDAIAAIMETNAVLAPNQIVGEQEMIDQISIIVLAMRQEPDADRTNAALSHFESMILHNRTFWNMVAFETDDDAEWLPNSAQTSAFGLRISAEVAETWLSILDEGGDILMGETVLPFWRDALALPAGAENARQGAIGLNLRKMLTDPAPIDLALWVQGAGALPYLSRGTVANGRNWTQFMRLLGGDAPLYALWFN